jgi:hypothetical protein
MKALRSTLLGLVVLLGVGSLGGCYAGPYHGGYYHSRPGYYSRGYNNSYYGRGYGQYGRGYGHYGRGYGHYGRGYNYYGPGYGRLAVPPPAPVCRRVWVPPRADFLGRWHPGHWRCV